MNQAQSRHAFAQPVKVLMLAIWFGLATGFAEFGLLLIRKLVQNSFLYRTRDAIWMIPSLNALLFAILGLGLWAAFRLWPRKATLPMAVGAFAFVSFTTLLGLYPLYQSAIFVLAAGLAVQTARFASQHAPFFERLVRRSTGWMALIVAALAVGLPISRLLAERRALSRLPPAGSGTPNVLLIILDTVRSLNLSLYGYHRPTSPGLERWARSGVRFGRAFSTSSWTLPSHGSILTGRYAHELAADWETPLKSERLTLAEVLGSHGYATAGFVANTVYSGWETGLDQGFAHYEDDDISLMSAVRNSSLAQSIYPTLRDLLEPLIRERPSLNWLKLPSSNEQKLASDINAAFLRWVVASDGRPFFAFLNYMDAHVPYRLGEGFPRKFRSAEQPGVDYSHTWDQSPPVRVNPAQLQPKQDAYDNAVAYLDSELEALFVALEQRGLLANTLVVLTSDHGEEFAEHGLVDHGNSLYRQSVQVPLVLSFPGRLPAGSVVHAPVSLRNVPATILRLVGIEGAPRLPGRPLTRFWTPPSSAAALVGDTIVSTVRRVRNQPPWYPASKGDMHSLAFGGFRYIKNFGDGREELFDFERDSLEQHDLSKSKQGQPLIPEYRAALNRMLSRP